MRVPVDEAALQPLHPGTGQHDLWHAAGRHDEDLGRDRHLLGTGQDHDDSLCAGLDAAFDRRADHPQCGHGPVAAGQRRHAGWRGQRLARALQHPGPDRPRPAVQLAAGLPDPGRRCRTGLRRVHRQTRLQAAAPGAAVVLAELRQVPRQPDEGLVWRQCHGRKQLGLRLAAQARRAGLRRAAHVRDDGPGQGQRLRVPRLQPDRRAAGQEPCHCCPGQAEVAGDHGPAGHRDFRVLA
ncbi:hypothetical protein D3C76_921320 [compost metagenome]